MKRFNISTKKVYTKNGVENAQWNPVGTLVRFDATPEKQEGYKLELHMFPNETYYVFEQKPKVENAPVAKKETIETQSEEEIKAEDIPF